MKKPFLKYEPRGYLAIGPKAFGFMFDMPEKPAPEMHDGIAVVKIHGPLMHHEEWFFDSYDAIKARVAEALNASPKALVLRIDSPGGLVAGCFETSRELRAMCAAAGVPLHAYVDGCATSAAYALACAAESITAPATAMVGSIGVVDALVDVTAMDALMGVRYAFVASGDRKTDGQSHVAITEAAIAASQARVDELAEMFFALVAEARPVTVDEVRALEAGIVHGASAESVGLTDAIATFDQLLASLASGVPTTTTQEGTATMSAYEDAVAALRKAAESDDKEEAANAKKMLAALEDDSDKKDEESAESEDDTEDAPKDEPPKSEDDDEDPKAMARLALQKLAALEAKQTTEAEKSERASLIASRPDFSPELLAVCKTAPLATVRQMVSTLPKGPVRKPAATTTVQATRGAGQGDGKASRLPSHEKAALDAEMGLTTAKSGVHEVGNKLYLGRAPVTGKEG